MTWGSRLCRTCGVRFAPTRMDERSCAPCSASESELRLVVRYVRSHPGEPLTRVALATGVSEEAICGFARDGRLERVPPGAEPEHHCSCPAGRPGSCQRCRAALAARLHEAVRESHAAQRFASPPAKPLRGMTTRRQRP